MAFGVLNLQNETNRREWVVSGAAAWPPLVRCRPVHSRLLLGVLSFYRYNTIQPRSFPFVSSFAHTSMQGHQSEFSPLFFALPTPLLSLPVSGSPSTRSLVRPALNRNTPMFRPPFFVILLIPSRIHINPNHHPSR